jgi:hypothetical protein
MLVMVALPVQEMDFTPGPKYSTILLVPPLTVSFPHSARMTSFGDVQLERDPMSFTPINLGFKSSQGIPAITSTASAPPTPIAHMPRPPAFGV